MRDKVLTDTIEKLLADMPADCELLVVDQTPKHEPATAARLAEWVSRDHIRLIKRDTPSIPQAMNHALHAARGEIVLFLDDDIIPDPGLVLNHLDTHRKKDVAVVAGRVIQPWDEQVEFPPESPPFNGLLAGPWGEFMGGNFSVRRSTALALGGFDENFVRVAYRFEAEFAFRCRQSGHHIYYEPAACIHHLKVSSGGTRSYGAHLTTMRPDHAVGAYYYAMQAWQGWASLEVLLFRPVRAIATRHHLLRPWYIPLTLIGEVRGLFWAIALMVRGARLSAGPSAASEGIDREP
jgi:GT2 family glycosyltransferase